MKRLHLRLWLMALSLILTGCAAAPPVIIEKPNEIPVAAAPQRPSKTFLEPPSTLLADRELLLRGVGMLHPAGPPDPEGARKIFATLLLEHPQSLWRPVAESFLRLINESETQRTKVLQETTLKEKALTERAKVSQENEQLKKALRELTEKLQVERGTLTQENEQLKKDLQRLKALEIELQRRERMLR